MTQTLTLLVYDLKFTVCSANRSFMTSLCRELHKLSCEIWSDEHGIPRAALDQKSSSAASSTEVVNGVLKEARSALLSCCHLASKNSLEPDVAAFWCQVNVITSLSGPQDCWTLTCCKALAMNASKEYHQASKLTGDTALPNLLLGQPSQVVHTTFFSNTEACARNHHLPYGAGATQTFLTTWPLLINGCCFPLHIFSRLAKQRKE